MANLYRNLPAPAGNGVGAAVDVSDMGPIKSLVGGGNARAQVTIEANNAAVATDGTWAPVASWQSTGQATIQAAVKWMRVRVSGFNPYVGGAIEVDVGSTDDAADFASLDVPAGVGVGAAVDTSALGLFKSVQVGNAFRGMLIVEISEDGNDWAQPFSFQAPGLQSSVIAAKWMRVRRVGVPDVNPGAPIVNVGASEDLSGAGGVAISAGTQLASTGTVAFANSNGVSFGMSGSSRITASVLPETPFGISAGTSSASTGTIAFANSNGISFGLDNNQMTASYSQSTAPSAIGANTVSRSSGTILFSNSNNVSFGMTGSTITASASFSAAGGVAFSAGSQLGSTGTVALANSNGFSFGMSGSSQITMQDFSYSLGLMTDALWTASSFGQSFIHIRPVTLPNLAFSYVGIPCQFSGATNSTATLSWTFSVGFYTRNVSSLSLMHSSSFSGTVNHSGTVNSAINDGVRIATAPWTSTVTKGNYALAFASATATAGAAVSFSYYAQSQQNFSGILGVASNQSIQRALGYGILSVATAAMPASIAISDIAGTGLAAQRPVMMQFGSTF